MNELISKAAKYLATNIRALREAPLIFVATVWIVFVAAYFVVEWRYAAILERRNAAIDILRARLVVAERSAEELREKLAAASQPTQGRAPDGVYQFGMQVGAVQQPRIDEAAGMAWFVAITGASKLKVERDIEYRDLVLHIRTVGIESQPTVAGQATRSLQMVTCDIIDRVPAP